MVFRFAKFLVVVLLLASLCEAEAKMPLSAPISISEGVWRKPLLILPYSEFIALPLARRAKYISELRKFLIQQEQTQAHFNSLFGWNPTLSPFWRVLLEESAVAEEEDESVFPDSSNLCHRIDPKVKYRRGVEYLIGSQRDRCVIAGRVICMALTSDEPRRLSCRLKDMGKALQELAKIPGTNEVCPGKNAIACQFPFFLGKDNKAICKQAPENLSLPTNLTSICSEEKNQKTPEEIAEVLKADPTMEIAYRLAVASVRAYCGESAQAMDQINGFDRTDCLRLHERLAAVALPETRGANPSGSLEIEVSGARPDPPSAAAPAPPLPEPRIGGPAAPPAPAPAAPVAPAPVAPPVSGDKDKYLTTCTVAENRSTDMPGFSYEIYKKADGKLRFRITWKADSLKREWRADGVGSNFPKIDISKPFDLEDMGDGQAALIDMRSDGRGPYSRIQFPGPNEFSGGVPFCSVILAKRFNGQLTDANECRIQNPLSPGSTLDVPNFPSQAHPSETPISLFGQGAQGQARAVPFSRVSVEQTNLLKKIFGEGVFRTENHSFRGAWSGKNCVISFGFRALDLRDERIASLAPAAVPANGPPSSGRPRRTKQ